MGWVRGEWLRGRRLADTNPSRGLIRSGCAITKVTMFSRNGLLAGKNSFGHHDMYALVAIDQLSNIHIAGDASEHIGIVATQMLLGDQEVDHLAHRCLGRLVELLMKTHADVLRRWFRTRVLLIGSLLHDKLQSAHQRSF